MSNLEHDELRDAFRDWLGTECRFDTLRNPPADDLAQRRASWSQLADLGWTGLLVPEAHGGLDLGLAATAVLYEEMGRYPVALPMVPTNLAVQLIAAAGDDALVARWLPSIAAGTCVASLALPSDAGAPLVADADGKLHGSLDAVLFAAEVDLLCLPVTTSDGGIRFALIERTEPGVRVRAQPIIDLTRRMGSVVLSGVSPAAMLAVDDAALSALTDHAALAIACDAAGGMQAVLDMTVAYLGTRQQFGRPIGSFQALKHRAANWKIQMEAAIALCRHAARLAAGQDAQAAATASEAKAYAADIYAALAGDAVQLHGGIGFTWEHDCHVFLKRAKLNQQLFGSSTHHRERAARRLFHVAA